MPAPSSPPRLALPLALKTGSEFPLGFHAEDSGREERNPVLSGWNLVPQPSFSVPPPSVPVPTVCARWAGAARARIGRLDQTTATSRVRAAADAQRDTDGHPAAPGRSGTRIPRSRTENGLLGTRKAGSGLKKLWRIRALKGGIPPQLGGFWSRDRLFRSRRRPSPSRVCVFAGLDVFPGDDLSIAASHRSRGRCRTPRSFGPPAPPITAPLPYGRAGPMPPGQRHLVSRTRSPERRAGRPEPGPGRR
jgi:hypothetical protein